MYPNSTLKHLIARTTCRAFDASRDVLESDLHWLRRAAAGGPNGGNLQPFSFVEVHEKKTREWLAKECGNQKFIAQAPLHLLACIDWRRTQRWMKLEKAPCVVEDSFSMFWVSLQDTLIATQNIVTAAESLGIASCYIGMVYKSVPALRERFALPPLVHPVVLLALGYPHSQERSPSAKLPTETIFHREKYADLSDAQLSELLGVKHAPLQQPANAENLRKFQEIATYLGGATFAQQAVAEAQERGFLTPAQVYFTLKYNGISLVDVNEALFEEIRLSGFQVAKNRCAAE